VKVLYIAGSSRCGSTILGNILGELDGFFNGGEIRFLWSRVLQGRRCGCQRPVDECPVWKSVLPSGGRDRQAIQALDHAQHAVLRLHHSPKLLRRSPKSLLRSRELANYVRAMTDVYKRLSGVTHARLIVDSSKRPSNAAALRLIHGVDPYVIHLVRDSRGVAHSRLRPKANPDGAGEMPIVSSWVSGIDWMATNLAAEDLTRHWPPDRTILLRYEDFVTDPRNAIDRIAAFVGERIQPDPFIDDNAVKLGANHTVSGNPDRFERGPVRLRADVEWLDRMRSLDRGVTTALTLPLLVRYGYPFRSTVRTPSRVERGIKDPSLRPHGDKDDTA
jgi:Sulfotransferase family